MHRSGPACVQQPQRGGSIALLVEKGVVFCGLIADCLRSLSLSFSLCLSGSRDCNLQPASSQHEEFSALAYTNSSLSGHTMESRTLLHKYVHMHARHNLNLLYSILAVNQHGAKSCEKQLQD